MRRREFVAGLGAAAAVWPLAARAQQPAMPVVGFLRSTTLKPFENLVTAFRQGLNGYTNAHDTQLWQETPDTSYAILQDLTADFRVRLANLGKARAIIFMEVR